MQNLVKTRSQVTAKPTPGPMTWPSGPLDPDWASMRQKGTTILRLRLGGRERERQTDRQTERDRDRDREGQHSKAPKAGGLSSSHASKAATIPASSLISKGLLQS